MTKLMTHFVINHDTFYDCFVEHFFVPLRQTFGFRNFHVGRMTVENIIVTFTRGASPDVPHRIPDEKTQLLCDRWEYLSHEMTFENLIQIVLNKLGTNYEK